MKKIILFVVVLVLFLGCSSEDSNSSSDSSIDSKYSLEYKGLSFYSQNMSLNSYSLSPLTQSEFNDLSLEEKYLVSDKLLSTLFFGMNQQELQEHFDNNDFIDTVLSN